jgi:hypothetical protein
VLGASAFGVTLSGTDLTLDLNLGFGADASGRANSTTLDMSGAKALVVRSGAAGTVTLDARDELLELGGTFSVKVGDQFSASGSLVISRQTRDILVAGKALRATGFVIGASDLQGSIGGVNLLGSGKGLSLALAMLRPLDAQAGDSRAWLALKASVDTLSLDGSALGLSASDLSVTVKSLALETNLAMGVVNGRPVTDVMDLANSTVDRRIQVRTGKVVNSVPQTVALDFASAAGGFLSLALDADIRIAGSVLLQGTFGMARLGGRSVTLNDGSRRDMQVTALSARGVKAQLGTGVGTAGFVGVELAGADLGLMVLDAGQGQGSFVGLRASAASASVLGLPGLTIKGGALTLGVNTGPGTGALAGKVVDFTQGDLDADGKRTGATPVRLRGATVTTLNFNAPTVEAGGTITLELRDAGAKPTDSPLIGGTAGVGFRVVGGQTVIGATGLNATVAVGGQRAGIVDGSMLLVLPGQGFALSMAGTAVLPVPGLAGVSIFGDISVALNRTGSTVNQSPGRGRTDADDPIRYGCRCHALQPHEPGRQPRRQSRQCAVVGSRPDERRAPESGRRRPVAAGEPDAGRHAQPVAAAEPWATTCSATSTAISIPNGCRACRHCPRRSTVRGACPRWWVSRRIWTRTGHPRQA